MTNHYLAMQIVALVLPHLAAWSLDIYQFLWRTPTTRGSSRTPPMLFFATAANLVVIGSALALALRGLDKFRGKRSNAVWLFVAGYAVTLATSLLWPVLLMNKAIEHHIALLTLFVGAVVVTFTGVAYAKYDRQAPALCVVTIVYIVYAYYKIIFDYDLHRCGTMKQRGDYRKNPMLMANF